MIVPDEAGESIEQLGTKRKFWFNDKRLLFKQGRPGTGENWAEKVACELCGLLQLPHAHYDLAVWRGQPGVVTTSFLPPQWRLVHGNELLARIYPDYLTNQRYKRRQHTVSAFIGVGRGWTGLRVEPPPAYTLALPLRVAADVMVGYLMLDCLVGNQDRHDENWGLMVHAAMSPRVALAPTYDHASSLGRNETDARRRSILGAKDWGAGLDAYCARARSAFYIHPDNDKPAGTLEAFASARRLRGAAATFWLERLASLGPADFEAIFQQVPPDLISDAAIDFAMRMLDINRARLLALAGR
ncbi:hypothetical protein THSYN_22795 [Candidatus Thiodictyon syntrophicum]|uniref:HipA-like C-terminal domain-containing protein n=1 Tax=Candidatus Thiodictyon syntrophicum TaxID=1166950 RepID=A0A2K8UHE2_9GAMM|nr:hypothetical protein THSYN_22795 [Candidatus Thiodictyon syntrophicum]